MPMTHLSIHSQTAKHTDWNIVNIFFQGLSFLAFKMSRFFVGGEILVHWSRQKSGGKLERLEDLLLSVPMR